MLFVGEQIQGCSRLLVHTCVVFSALGTVNSGPIFWTIDSFKERLLSRQSHAGNRN